MEKLNKVQLELKAVKDKKNQFGGFSYRNIESIYTELKPILAKYNCHLKMTSDLVQLGDKTFIKVVATFVDIESGYEETATSFAAIDFTHKGMSAEQATGAAQTYASKYAINHLFLIDDGSLEPDAMAPKGYEEKQEQPTQQKPTHRNMEFSEIRSLMTIDALKKWYDDNVKDYPAGNARNKAIQILGERKEYLLNAMPKGTNNNVIFS